MRLRHSLDCSTYLHRDVEQWMGRAALTSEAFIQTTLHFTWYWVIHSPLRRCLHSCSPSVGLVRRPLDGNQRYGSPDLGLFGYELLHQAFAFFVLKYNQFNTFLLKICLAADKGSVFPNHDPCNLVQNAGSCAHLAWGKSCVHCGTPVSRRRESTSVLQCSNFSLKRSTGIDSGGLSTVKL